MLALWHLTYQNPTYTDEEFISGVRCEWPTTSQLSCGKLHSVDWREFCDRHIFWDHFLHQVTRHPSNIWCSSWSYSDIDKLLPHRSTNCLTSVVWSDTKISSLSRRQQVQQRLHNFWQRWSTDLLDLQQGARWIRSEPNIKITRSRQGIFRNSSSVASAHHNRGSPSRLRHNLSANSQNSAGNTNASYT